MSVHIKKKHPVDDKITKNCITEEENVDQSWEKLETIINEAAFAAFSSRDMKIIKGKPNKTPWFRKGSK